MIYTWMGTFIALFLFMYPSWEDDRRRMRRNDRELEARRLNILIQYGIDPREVDVDHMSEWLHWRQHGRGVPYAK